MADTDPNPLVGGFYRVDLAQPLPEAAGGLSAFAAIDRRGNRAPAMAIRADRRAPVRNRALQTLTTHIDGMLSPLAHGPGPDVGGEAGWYVICEAPIGRPLSASPRPWSEGALIDLVLRPAAYALEQLREHGLTHRAIRPGNVFQAAPNRPVTLGAAWAAPPAMHQPAVFETAYAAMCIPTGRGDGTIADDVYALGVLLIALALGRDPLAGLDPLSIVHRKLELGDYAALTAGERLPPLLADLARGMLAEDPDHRPPPSLLRDPGSARGRRVAARPPAHASRPFRMGGLTVWNNRTLAMAAAFSPAETVAAIETGTLTYWLRRGLGDSALAVKLDDLSRGRPAEASGDKAASAAFLAMRAAMSADTLMPICWRGLILFPGGFASALAAAYGADPDTASKLDDIVQLEIATLWATMREDRESSASHIADGRRWRAIARAKGPASGLPRLAYTLDPLMPCASPLFAGKWIYQAGQLAAALDAAAVSKDVELLEPAIAAFIAARTERWLDTEVKALAGPSDAAGSAMNALRLFAELQSRFHPAPLPQLAAWIAARAEPLVELWKNRERRAAVEEQLKAQAGAGWISGMAPLLDNAPGLAADRDGLRAAANDLAVLDAELRGLATGGAHRADIAARLGQEIAAGLGVSAVAATLLLAALG